MKDLDYVVFHDGTQRPYGTIECRRCGQVERLPIPIRIRRMVAWIGSFSEEHEECAEEESGTEEAA